MENADTPIDFAPEIQVPLPEEPTEVPPLDLPSPAQAVPPPVFVPSRPRAIPTDAAARAKAAVKASKLRAKLRDGKSISNDNQSWLDDYDGGHREYYPGGDLRAKSKIDSPHVPPLNVPGEDSPPVAGSAANPEILGKEPSKAKKDMAKKFARKYGDFLKSANVATLKMAREGGYDSFPVVPDFIIDNLTVPSLESYLMKSPILDKILEQADDEQAQLAIVLGSGAVTGLSYAGAKVMVARKKKTAAVVRESVAMVNVVNQPPKEDPGEAHQEEPHRDTDTKKPRVY